MRDDPNVFFAGQITGVEGYVESAAIGLLAGRFAAAARLGVTLPPPPLTTAFGALLNHITGGHLSADDNAGARSFQPMNVNFGLFPPIDAPPSARGKGPRSSKGFERKRAMATRALADLDRWLVQPAAVAAE
jgi:methylenetetrahydrofolate--tRNA-(uracil-5-)-methyltransferase